MRIHSLQISTYVDATTVRLPFLSPVDIGIEMEFDKVEFRNANKIMWRQQVASVYIAYWLFLNYFDRFYSLSEFLLRRFIHSE